VIEIPEIHKDGPPRPVRDGWVFSYVRCDCCKWWWVSIHPYLQKWILCPYCRGLALTYIGELQGDWAQLVVSYQGGQVPLLAE
jgi:hypothetical protein